MSIVEVGYVFEAACVAPLLLLGFRSLVLWFWGFLKGWATR